MRRPWPILLLVLCGIWAALADCAIDIARGASGTSDERRPPVWGPKRPGQIRVAQAPQDAPRPTPDPPRSLAPPTGTETIATPQPVEAGPVLIEPRRTVVHDPFAGPSPAVDDGPLWIDGYSDAAFGPVMEDGLPVDESTYRGGLRSFARNLHVFAGVHGFKGPTDWGSSGNFGFHEGLNWGGPLFKPWGYGCQVGAQLVHSNFTDNRTVDAGPLPSFGAADRNQVFVTAGFFNRPLGPGWQAGMAFDMFFDSYYPGAQLYQLRSETAFVLNDYNELGYWGAYGVSKETISGLGQFDSVLDPTDMFAVFYRRRFTGGGKGRLWAGISGHGDAILGLDGTIPLGTNWALENNFTCLFPKHGQDAGQPPQESWSVAIQLVWYPAQPSRQAIRDRYHPLFYVADNSWFLVNRRR